MLNTLSRPILLTLVWFLLIPSYSAADELTVYVAKEIVTMDPSMPTATMVAVRDDRIVAVGSLETLRPWLSAHDYRIDETFDSQVLFPGFIDPHLHPSFAASLLHRNHIITAEDWELPTGTVRGVPDRESYFSRLRSLVNQSADTNEPFFTWGWNSYWHGPLTRDDLDRVSKTRPIIVTQRSAHEVILNTPALNTMNIGPEVSERNLPGVDWEAGRFWEAGQSVVRQAINVLVQNTNDTDGLSLVADLIHRGGVTTIADPGTAPTVGSEGWNRLLETFDTEHIPFRTLLFPRATSYSARPGTTLADKFDRATSVNTSRLMFRKGVKHFADGAMFAQYMQLSEPGYIDGHEGEWLTPPEQLKPEIAPFWKAGFDINIHVNGDRGVDVTLDALDTLLHETPRFDIRYILQHFGISRPDQARRAGRLGATVSATGYYLWLLGDKWSTVGIGPDRADRMIRLRTLVRNGVVVTLHSDLPMGPVRPLLAVWSVVTRKTSSGTVRGPEEALTLDQALKAITIDAAWSLRMDHEIGSIEPGKKADFVVLDENPYSVAIDDVKDIKIWGTVFEGKVYPATTTAN